jgi:predicted nuclease of predicted toxin-antitoxin system
MARTIRFHLDEHCDPAIATGLRLHGVDVTTTVEAGLLHAQDEDHIAYALRTRRTVFTQDKDFLRLHAAGVEHAGIAFCQQKKSRGIGQIIAALLLIWEIYEPEEIQNHVEFL